MRSAWNEIWLNFCLKCYVVCTISSININSSQLSFNSMSGLCIFKKCLLSKIRAKLCRCLIVFSLSIWSSDISCLEHIFLSPCPNLAHVPPKECCWSKGVQWPWNKFLGERSRSYQTLLKNPYLYSLLLILHPQSAFG